MNDLPIHAEQMDVPVFDCHVLISGPDETGQLAGVVSNLPEIHAVATNERSLLLQVSRDFKAAVRGYLDRKEEIPWQEIQKPESGQRQRWLPVHL